MNEIEYPADDKVDGKDADGSDVMDGHMQIPQHAGNEPGCCKACQYCYKRDEY